MVIAAGGGGIPTMYEPGKERHLIGVECVIDKDRASALLAKEIGADTFVVATDADAVYLDWGKPEQRAIRSASPDALDAYSFPAGSMGPKVEAAQDFARTTGGAPSSAPCRMFRPRCAARRAPPFRSRRGRRLSADAGMRPCANAAAAGAAGTRIGRGSSGKALLMRIAAPVVVFARHGANGKMPVTEASQLSVPGVGRYDHATRCSFGDR